MRNIICGFLEDDINLGCDNEEVIEFADQRTVLINWESIIRSTVDIDNDAHTVEFSLEENEKGAHIIGHAGGDSISDLFTANVSDTGRNMFQHQVDFIFGGKAEMLEKYKEELAKGKFVAATKVGETILITGINQGMYLEEGTTFDRRENEGEYIASIMSRDNRQESKTPLIYKSAAAGDPIADFFADFEGAA